MKILFNIKEYAKKQKLSEISIRKKISSNSIDIIKIDKESYIIEDDSIFYDFKQTIKNKNSKIRELKLRLQVQELNKTVNKLESILFNNNIIRGTIIDENKKAIDNKTL